MKKILFCVLFCVFSCSFLEKNTAPEQYNQMEFVEGSKDIPLAKGLSKNSNDDDLGFDSEGGSVVFISYKNEVGTKEVRDFYLKTLPQMGWEMSKNNDSSNLNIIDFVRDNEKLEIEFAKQNNVDLVKFFVESSTN